MITPNTNPEILTLISISYLQTRRNQRNNKFIEQWMDKLT